MKVMAKTHVSNLTSRALDYAVAIAIGEPVEWLEDFQLYGVRCGDDPIACTPLREYSTDWSVTGPLIDEYNIDLCCEWEEMHCATMNTKDGNSIGVDWQGIDEEAFFYGKTKLEAACRCIVGHKLGEWINVPNELVNDEDNA